MADNFPLMGIQPPMTNSLSASPDFEQALQPLTPPDPYSNDRTLLDLFDRLKREAFDQRWVWERDWLRSVNYVAGRQWITYHPTKRQWIDKRLQKWIPRPVTNKMAETLQAIRTNLAAIQLAVKARPNGYDTKSIATAEVADQMAPLIHEEHDMNQVMREADFWFIATGNACLQVSWDKDNQSNKTFIPFDQCTNCYTISPPQAIVEAGQVCPVCGANSFIPAQDEQGQPVGEEVVFGKGKTTALSPFEYAFPPNITRFKDLPYIIRIRWRNKHWIEANRPELLNKLNWEKSPTDRSLQLLKSLSTLSDLSFPESIGAGLGASSADSAEGVTEYELWLKPTPDFPKGLVMRVLGDTNPILVRNQEEGLPGPFPYTDIEDHPIFPFVHAQYEHVGGRLYGRSALAPLFQKQDQLNQLDSLIQLIVQRMANPIWVVPEGAGIEHFTGEPGLIMKWQPLGAASNAKPERIAGAEVPTSLQLLRAQLLKDMEELSGAFDIIKGQKPTGVAAFSALQLLVERSQSRFTSAFQARGEMYRNWFSIALELERKFGPEQRVWSVLGPNRGHTFRHFQRAQLQGQISIQMEDGSNMPKTALGKRASIEQANQLGLLNPADPDQRYALLSSFGLSDLSPSLNFHVQAALQVQDAFERWAAEPVGPSPLVFKPWFDPQVHWTERIKWLNTDKMRELLAERSELEPIVTQHLQLLNFVMTPPVLPAEGGGEEPTSSEPQGGALALRGSNRESGATDTLPQGNREVGPSVGPA